MKYIRQVISSPVLAFGIVPALIAWATAGVSILHYS